MSNGVTNNNLQTFADLYGLPPANNTNIQTPAQAVAGAVNEGAVDNKAAAKGDVITIAGKQISKKKAIIGSATILAAIAGVAALAISGKFGTAKIGKEVDALTKEAGELANEARKTIDNVTAKFNEMIAGNKTEEVIDGKTITKLIDDADNAGRKIMNEFTEDGETLLRTSNFEIHAPKEGTEGPTGYVLTKIQENIKGTDNKFNIIKLEDGKLSEYLKELEVFENGSSKAAQVLLIDENGTLNAYRKGVTKSADDDWIAAQEIVCNSQGKPTGYYKNCGEYITEDGKAYELNENGKWQKHKSETNNLLDDFEDDFGDNGKFNDEFDNDYFDD